MPSGYTYPCVVLTRSISMPSSSAASSHLIFRVRSLSSVSRAPSTMRGRWAYPYAFVNSVSSPRSEAIRRSPPFPVVGPAGQPHGSVSHEHAFRVELAAIAPGLIEGVFGWFVLAQIDARGT